MKKLTQGLAISLFILSAVAAHAQEKSDSIIDKIKWQVGPCVADIGGMAQEKVPDGYVFADGKDTRLLMEEMQNIPSGRELGFLAPKNLRWFVVFEFKETGYIKDDEKDSLDASAMLKSIQKATEAANKERTKRGWPGMDVVGWQQAPRYNPSSHNLEWAIQGQTQGEQEIVVNWNTRLLGRKGVMSVTLVADPGLLTEVLPRYTSLMNEDFTFKEGSRYADFRQGDKVAKYGLTALVVGGAAAVATKTGMLKWLWKVIALGFVAVAGSLKKIFNRKKEIG